VVYNAKGGLQVIYDQNRNPVEIPQGFFTPFPLSAFYGTPGLVDVRNPDDFIGDSPKVIFAKSYALGDGLMLVPVAREFKAKWPGKKITLAIGASYIPTISLLHEDAFDRIVPSAILFNNRPTPVIGFFLDGVLEVDHQGGRESYIHRVDLYREFMGLPTGVNPVWSEKERFVGEQGVVFCSGGSQRIKQLPKETVDFILEKLTKKYWAVTHISNGNFLPPETLVEKIRNARVLITMDSSPLWIAHFTGTPVVLLSGPTRGLERLSYHPLYREGTAEVSMSQMVNCEPCFERKLTCGGAITCMQAPKEKIWAALSDAVESVIWKTK
jgi:ADP-heptose:LPS heptosyltransferase